MIKNAVRIVLIISLFLFGCSNYRKVTGPVNRLDFRKTVDERLKPKKFPEHLLIENADIQLHDANQMHARLLVYIEKDKKIFVALRYLGFEIARAEIDPDSVHFINRMQKKYFFGTYDEVYKFLPLDFDFYTLQRLIYTGFFYTGDERLREFARNFKRDQDGYIYERIIDEGKKLQLYYDNVDIKLDKIYLSDYIDHLLAEIQINREQRSAVPLVLNGNIIDGNKARNVEISIKSIKHKDYSKTDFRIGKNYKKIERLF